MQIKKQDEWTRKITSTSIENFVRYTITEYNEGGTIEQHAANIENTLSLIGRFFDLLAEKNILSAPEIVTLVNGWTSEAAKNAVFIPEQSE